MSETAADRLPTLRRDGAVFVLDLGDGENRFNPAWVGAIEGHLDTVEAAEGPRALVTVAEGKLWSNGLDLEYLGAHPDELGDFLDRVHRLFGRVLGLGAPTVAAVQGHAFAAGAMLAVCHDRVVMREDRGYWCVPEVDLRMPFTAGMTALLTDRLPAATAREAMLTGRRYGGQDAKDAGIVDAVAPEGEVLARALDLVRPLADKDPATVARIKAGLHAATLAELGRHQEL